MIRKISFIFLLALLVSCQEDNGYSISGSIDNAPDGTKIYISELNDTNNQTTPIDTAEVKNGKFELDLPEKDAATVSFLTVEKIPGSVLFIAQDKPITFELYKDSLYASKIEGGKDNELLIEHTNDMRGTQKDMMALRQEMMAAYTSRDSIKMEGLNAKQQKIIDETQANKQRIVDENPNSIISLMIFQDMVSSQLYSPEELQTTFDKFSPELKNSGMGKNIEETLTNLTKVSVGKKAPDFSAPTPTGEELALKDVLGKVTLVDFWASWCKPCRVENPNIVKVYEKYHDKGFNIIGVSLDRPDQKDKWEKAIADDNLSWNQVSNLQFWQDPIALEYGVRAIPAAFLLDENGVIVAKNLRGQDLENKVAELLGEAEADTNVE